MPDASQDPRLGSAKPEAKREGDFADAIREQTLSFVGKRKTDAARAVSDIADAIRTSGTDFDSYPHVKAFFDSAAEGVEEFPEGLNRRTFSEIYDEVEAAVRRRPGVSAAAAALAGFALYRFFKASELRPIPRSQPWCTTCCSALPPTRSSSSQPTQSIWAQRSG